MTTQVAVIDFETRSKVELKKSGVWRYAFDPSTEILCLGYAIDDRPVNLWVPGEQPPEDLLAAVRSGYIIEAHNAMFERAVWAGIMTPRYGWPAIKPEQWRCSAARAAVHALPRNLHMVGEVLGLTHQKDMDNRTVMLKLSRPRKATLKNKHEWNNSPLDLKNLFLYCMKDVESEREIRKHLRDLSEKELKIWQLDQKMNARGVCVDMDFVQSARYLIAEYTAELTKRIQVLTNNEVTAATERDGILEWLLEKGHAMTGLTKNDVTEILKSDLPSDVKEVLCIRQELGKTSTAKYEAILKAVCTDGKLRDLLMYHGASTGRWSGKLVQPQNFPRLGGTDIEQCIRIIKRKNLDTFRLVYPEVMKTLSAILRGVFIPSAKRTMVGGDYNAIEARVLFWLADEKRGLEMFEKGVDLYVDLAKEIYPGQEITKEKRDLGKRGILGAGYQMGKDKFKDTCKQLFGLDINDEIAERTIITYRQKYHSVQKLWWDQQAAAIQAVKTCRPVKCGKVLWAVSGKFLYCRLPSGRCLAYYGPKIELKETPWKEMRDSLTYMAVNSTSKKWERTHSYGGLLVENITQATARDLMAEAMLRAETAGYLNLLTVHDELLTETDSGSASGLKEIMEKLPDWATGLPIKAETWSGKRYTK